MRKSTRVMRSCAFAAGAGCNDSTLETLRCRARQGVGTHTCTALKEPLGSELFS